MKRFNTIQLILGFMHITGFAGNAQNLKTIVIRFEPTINHKAVESGTNYYMESLQDSISIETLQFYVSHPEFLVDGDWIQNEVSPYSLFDLEKEDTHSLRVQVPAGESYSQIRFNLGVDSITNMGGAQGGALDPTNGMYWTWQSGYINFKLEGITKSCPARKNKFQYHIGGYQYPFNALQTINLTTSSQEVLTIEIALDELINKVDVSETFQLMSPSTKAMAFAQILPSIFSISQL